MTPERIVAIRSVCERWPDTVPIVEGLVGERVFMAELRELLALAERQDRKPIGEAPVESIVLIFCRWNQNGYTARKREDGRWFFAGTSVDVPFEPIAWSEVLIRTDPTTPDPPKGESR